MKRYFTRKEFEEERKKESKKLIKDTKLQKNAISLIEDADTYRWIHQTNWMGEPSLQLPQDLFAIQEAIFKTGPQVIIECGVCWGGTLLFCDTVSEYVQTYCRIFGVDIYIPEDLRERIEKINPSIELFNYDSLDKEWIKICERRIGNKRCMIILDSNHTHDHVYKELNVYSRFLKKGDYIVVCDTIIEDLKNPSRERPWRRGNNPRTALRQFLKENSKEFEIDEEIRNKLLISCQPDGYVRKKK